MVGMIFWGGIIIRKEMTKQKKKAAKQAPSRTGYKSVGMVIMSKELFNMSPCLILIGVLSVMLME